MYKFSKDELILLASLESIDSISIAAFRDEVTLHRGKHVGMYLSGHGVVLEPVYTEVLRFDDGDIIRVGKLTDSGIRYGAYSIKAKSLVIPIEYIVTDPTGGFWRELKQYDKTCNKSSGP